MIDTNMKFTTIYNNLPKNVIIFLMNVNDEIDVNTEHLLREWMKLIRAD